MTAQWYDRQARMLHCVGCGEMRALYSHSLDNPERFFARVLEPFMQEHTRCSEYKDQRMARLSLASRREMVHLDLMTRTPPPFFTPAAVVAPPAPQPPPAPKVDLLAAASRLAARWGGKCRATGAQGQVRL